jgi:hypothetical protein
MELIKILFIYSILTFIAAFILSFLLGGLVHLCCNQFTMTDVLYTAIGCGTGTGLACGITALFN